MRGTGFRPAGGGAQQSALMTADKPYEFFDHTADVGMRASGATLEELLVHAARGLVELLVEQSPVAAKESRSVGLQAEAAGALLQAWLTQLIVWFDAERFLPATFNFETVTETSLRGRIQGERFDPARHAHGVEVKGVTRHQFRVEKVNGRWEAELIFDV